MWKCCLDCGRPTEIGNRCPKHAAEHKQIDDARRRTRQSRSGINTKQWRDRIRPAVLARAAGQCEIRGPACTGQATSVHRLPEFGQYHDDNLDAYLASCASCHGSLTGARKPQPYPGWGRDAT